MGQQTLRTVITIGGRVDNSFGMIGETLMGLGSQIDGLSRKIIDFGKDSVEEFIDYDDLMREVKAVGEFTEGEMKALDAINTQIARTSIYSNKQAAEAEVFLGQLGLSVQEIKTLLPDVLELAQAGHLSIADSADYLYSSIKSLGLAIEDSDELTDMMAKTAAVGATDIDTLGESLTRMGSGLKMFKDGAPEVLAMLSGISQFGEDMRGQEGGTRLRNFMLSLVAPAGSGKQLLAELENLGMDQAEMNAYLEDEGIDLTSSAAAIQKLGLKVFDEAGNMRAATDIVVDLYNATKGMNDDLRSMTLRQIFGRREYIAAQNLMKPLEDDIDYYEKLIDVITNSEGFAGQMADEMQGGAGGAIRNLDASFADLKKTVGDLLEADTIGVADWLNDIVTSVAGLEENKLSALVYGLAGIAAAGPALIGVGAFIRTIGFLATPAGAIGAGLLVVAGLVGAIDQLYELDMTKSFGDMNLDETEIRDYISGIADDFSTAYGNITEFNTALDTAVANYQAKSSEFSSELTSKMITGTKLSPEDITQLQGLGKDMHAEIVAGIENATASQMSYLQQIFGGAGIAEDDPAYNDAIAILNDSYNGAISSAELLSQQLRDAMFSAFEDKILTEEESGGIIAIIEAQNKLLAEQADMENRIQMGALFHKAQSASLSDIEKYAGEIEAERQRQADFLEDQYHKSYATQEVVWDKAIEEGGYIRGSLATEKRKEAVLAGIEEQYNKELLERGATFDDALIKLWTNGIEKSDLANAWNALEAATGQFIEGDITGKEASDSYVKEYGGRKGNAGIREYTAQMLGSFGGADEVLKKIRYYQDAGDKQAAQDLMELFTMEALSNEFANTWIKDDGSVGRTTYPADILKKKRQLQDLWASYDGSSQPVIGLPDWEEPPLIVPDVEDGTGAGEAWTEEFESGAGTPQITVKINWSAPGAVNPGGGWMNPLGVSSMLKYADGGYADEPSIFGEAGGEWAIPEQHSQRTASLLDAAREGAGFSWGELIARNGGLNANAGQGVGQIIYSPRIYAQDARGVKEELEADKIRFRRAMEEYILTEETETYS